MIPDCATYLPERIDINGVVVDRFTIDPDDVMAMFRNRGWREWMDGSMTRKQWKEKWDTDPDFRLKRLQILQRRHRRRIGGAFPNDRAYELEIERALDDRKDRPHD